MPFYNYKNILKSILFYEDNIQHKIRAVAKKIIEYYISQDIHEIIVVDVLKGAKFAGVHLQDAMTKYIQKINSENNIEYHINFISDDITLSTYGDKTIKNSTPRIIKDMKEESKGKAVLIIEDLMDTSQTLKFFVSLLNTSERKPSDLKIFCVVDKTGNRETNLHPDFFCFEYSGGEWLVGYGMDFKDRFRNVPYIFTIKDEFKD